MSSPATDHLKQPPDATQIDAGAAPAKMLLVTPKLINWSALFFAVLQSVCTAVVALNGLRLLIGVAAFAAASGALKLADRIHGDRIRIPMMALALLGSLLNLFVLWRARKLRNRPAAQWRRAPLSATKKNSERLQYALSILTLILLAAEWLTHPLIYRVH